MYPGRDKAWNILAGLDPAGVCREAEAVYEPGSGLYSFRAFGMDMYISPAEKSIFSNAPGSDVLLRDLELYSGISFIRYLIHAKDIPFSGRLVRPEDLPGGHLFTKGTHVLPLDELSSRYSHNTDAFYLKGNELGAETLEYGDASIKLKPAPRIPVTLIFWEGDGEFRPRADLLLDSTSEFQAPIDILWSISMMTVLLML